MVRYPGNPASKQSSPSSSGRGQVAGAAARSDNPPEDDRPFAEIRRNLNDLVRMLALHRWAFFVPCCLVASTAFILSLYYPRTYRATTSFERRNDPIMVNLPNAAGAASFKYFRSTMSRDLTSVAYMADAVDNLDLTKDFEKNEDGTLTKASRSRRDSLARALGSRISISTTSPSEHVDIVRIIYTGPDPTIGRKLLDAVKATYIERTKVWMGEFLESQRSYFAQQLEQSSEVLRAAQREETKLRLENPYVNVKNPGAISTRLSELELEKRELSSRKREYREELSSMEQMFASAGPVAVAGGGANLGLSIPEVAYVSPETMQLIGELGKIDTKIATLRATRGMTDEHPDIKVLKSKRQAFVTGLETNRKQDRQVPQSNASMSTIAAARPVLALQPWQREQSRLRVQIASQQAKMRDVDHRMEANLAALELVRDAKRNLFQRQDEFEDATAAINKARRRYSEVNATLARIEPAIAAADKNRLVQFSKGDPARGGGIAVNPKAKTIVLLAVVCGIIAGVIFVVLAEILDNVYRSASRVSRSLGIPILEAIDEIVTSADRRRQLVRRAVVAPLLVGCCLVFTGVTGSMAYLSIERPWTYQQFKKIPEAALNLMAGKVPDSDESASQS